MHSYKLRLIRLAFCMIALVSGEALASEISARDQLSLIQRKLQTPESLAQRHLNDFSSANTAAFQIEKLKAMAQDLKNAPLIQEKSARLAAWIAMLQEHPEVLARHQSGKPTPSLRVQGAGTTCETAINLAQENSVSMPIAGGESIWFRISMQQAHGLRISTRGSDVDTRLTVFADCRNKTQTPKTQGDDEFGLQAEVSLASSDQSFWLARAENSNAIPGTLNFASTLAATISGRTARSAGGANIPNVDVTIFEVTATGQNYVGGMRSLSDGSYTLSVPNAGTYAMRVGTFNGNQGWLPEAYLDKPCRDFYPYDINSCGTVGNSFTPIVIANPSTTNINFELENAPEVYGTVTSADDAEPVSFQRVEAQLDSGGSYQTSTDATGRYRLFTSSSPFRLLATSQRHEWQLFDQVNCVTTFNGGTSCPFLGATLLNMQNNQSRRIDFRLKKLKTLNVRYTLDGQPSNNSRRLSLLNSNGAEIYASFSQGDFAQVGPLVPGNYYLRTVSDDAATNLYGGVTCITDCISQLSQGTPILVTEQSTALSIDVDLRSYPEITGRITQTNGAVINNASALLISVAQNGINRFVNATSNGEFRFENVPPGSYLLQAQAAGFVDELFDNVPCENQNPRLNCLGASPITVSQNSQLQQFDFA